MAPQIFSSIAFIGFGEAGHSFACGLLSRGSVRVAAHDALPGMPEALSQLISSEIPPWREFIRSAIITAGT
jgi:3-hydroxyisobutyrate dehydrogenase-like beta-hydroxyacid dehydrogenase